MPQRPWNHWLCPDICFLHFLSSLLLLVCSVTCSVSLQARQSVTYYTSQNTCNRRMACVWRLSSEKLKSRSSIEHPLDWTCFQVFNCHISFKKIRCLWCVTHSLDLHTKVIFCSDRPRSIVNVLFSISVTGNLCFSIVVGQGFHGNIRPIAVSNTEMCTFNPRTDHQLICILIWQLVKAVTAWFQNESAQHQDTAKSTFPLCQSEQHWLWSTAATLLFWWSEFTLAAISLRYRFRSSLSVFFASLAILFSSANTSFLSVSVIYWQLFNSVKNVPPAVLLSTTVLMTNSPVGKNVRKRQTFVVHH